MPNKTWKSAERELASVLHTRRNPLSGGNGKQTRSDTLHPTLYAECKYTAKSSLWTLYNDTKPKAEAEKKVPVLAVKQKGKSGLLLTVHSSDLDEFVARYLDEKALLGSETDVSDLHQT